MVNLEYDDSIREKLIHKGYYIVDGDYQIAEDYTTPTKKHHQKGEIVYLGLILENEKSEQVIADIRQGEHLVVLPRDEKETEQVKTLIEILEEERIPLRKKPYKD